MNITVRIAPFDARRSQGDELIYRAGARIFPDVAHDMMPERGQQSVTDCSSTGVRLVAM